MCTIGIESLDASLKKTLASAAKVRVVGDGRARHRWLAYCKGTEGNLGMMQSDPDPN